MIHVIAITDVSAAGSLNQALDDGQEEEEDEEDDEFDGPSPCYIAGDCIDKLACNLPMKYVWDAGLSLSIHYMQLDDPRYKKAGSACLGQLVEGCQDPMREQLPNVLPLVLAAAQNQDKYSRESACFCLGQMAEHCQPEIMAYQAQILPTVFALLDDPRTSVQVSGASIATVAASNLTAMIGAAAT